MHASEKDKALHLRENDIKSKSAGRVSIIENAENIQQVMKKLQHSNPCLEAFGNAKTTRNDNSSRFGKYMDIQFDFRGRAKGGHITTYLLEKSRVTSKSQGERSFHVFYQLLLCGDQALLDSLELKANPEAYAYLKSSKSSTSAASDQDHQADAATFKQVIESFHAIGITKDTWMYYLKVVAAIIHLGEVTFDETDCESLITNMEALRRVAQLLGLDKKKLAKCLTSRSVKDSKKSELATSSSAINVPLTRLQAIETRDALAKALYDNLFKRIVRNMNSLVETKKSTSKSDCVM